MIPISFQHILPHFSFDLSRMLSTFYSSVFCHNKCIPLYFATTFFRIFPEKFWGERLQFSLAIKQQPLCNTIVLNVSNASYPWTFFINYCLFFYLDLLCISIGFSCLSCGAKFSLQTKWLFFSGSVNARKKGSDRSKNQHSFLVFAALTFKAFTHSCLTALVFKATQSTWLNC